jgi:hypothetical protein
MVNNQNDIIQYHKEEVERIFRNKELFRRTQGQLPIEEKIKILVELQKIALTIIKQRNPEDPRQVWKINGLNDKEVRNE